MEGGSCCVSNRPPRNEEIDANSHRNEGPPWVCALQCSFSGHLPLNRQLGGRTQGTGGQLCFPDTVPRVLSQNYCVYSLANDVGKCQ